MAQRTAPSAPTKEDRWTYERYLRETAEGEYFTIYEEGDALQSPLLAGFTCAVKEVFEE